MSSKMVQAMAEANAYSTLAAGVAVFLIGVVVGCTTAAVWLSF